MSHKISIAGALIVMTTLIGCATDRPELTREQRVEKLRTEARTANKERNERQMAQYEHAKVEAGLDRMNTVPR